jgi:hypothetical protein
MGVTTAGRRVEAKADEAARTETAERVGRAGLAARGAIYCIVALLALRVAFGDNETADRRGALHAVARQPLGKVMLAVLTVGFLAYAAYRLLRAATGRKEEGSGERSGAMKRLANAGIALLYLALCASSASLVLGRSGGGAGGGGGDQQEKTWTARLLAHSWGEWLVAAVAVAVIVTGVVLVVMGLREKFADKLRTDDMRPWQRTWLPRLGLFGYAARGAVFVLIGGFLLRAAFEHDPNESVGVDGALHRLAAASFGPPLLALVALGLGAYGAYSFVEARWRRVLDA